MEAKNIGRETRAETIKKWRQTVSDKVELLLSFQVDPETDPYVAEFRCKVAQKIGYLADYLASGEWSLFAEERIGTPYEADLRSATASYERIKAEEPHDDKADAERAEAEQASAVAEEAPTVEIITDKVAEATEEPTIGGIPVSAFEEAQADIERRKAAKKSKKTAKKEG